MLSNQRQNYSHISFGVDIVVTLLAASHPITIVLHCSKYNIIHTFREITNLIILLLLHRFLRRKHSILHQTPLECPVHSFQTVRISYAFDITMWLKDESSGIIDTHPDWMTPGGNGGFTPVGCFHGSHHFGGVNEFFVCFYGDEVGMSPDIYEANRVKSSVR